MSGGQESTAVVTGETLVPRGSDAADRNSVAAGIGKLYAQVVAAVVVAHTQHVDYGSPLIKDYGLESDGVRTR